jgi:osmotically-inducible protein OsmY
MAKRYEDRYGHGRQGRDRSYADDRGYVDRATDEVRSWFGDDEAERRRHVDEQRDRGRERRYGMGPGQGEWSGGEWRRDDESRGEWPRSDYRYAQSERQRDDEWDRDRVIRDRDWPNREADWSTRYPSAARWPHRSPTWSADDGRMEFGNPASRSAVNRGDERRWGRGPKGYQRSDTRIHEEVCDRLTYSDVDAENVEVTVANGEVTLAGTVRDRWDKRRAEDLAEEVAGVREVHNSIRIARAERGIGHSETSVSDQPGTVLGVNQTAEAANMRRRS